jgi:hypothetical protein
MEVNSEEETKKRRNRPEPVPPLKFNTFVADKTTSFHRCVHQILIDHILEADVRIAL